LNLVKKALKKWYKYQYSGFITVPLVIIIVVWSLLYMTENLEFFHSWSCETLIQYKTDENLPSNIIPYDQLTDEQLKKYEKIVKTCMFNP